MAYFFAVVATEATEGGCETKVVEADCLCNLIPLVVAEAAAAKLEARVNVNVSAAAYEIKDGKITEYGRTFF